MKFECSKNLKAWTKKHKKYGCHPNNKIPGQFQYVFTPVGNFEIQNVKCIFCGTEYFDCINF